MIYIMKYLWRNRYKCARIASDHRTFWCNAVSVWLSVDVAIRMTVGMAIGVSIGGRQTSWLFTEADVAFQRIPDGRLRSVHRPEQTRVSISGTARSILGSVAVALSIAIGRAFSSEDFADAAAWCIWHSETIK